MTHKKLNRFVSLLLVMVTLIGMLALPASAASIVNSKTATIKYLGRTEILKKTGGSSMGASSWTYTTNDGLTGAAYCVNWGLSLVSASKALTLQPYNRSPKTMGAFANAYPMRSLEQFKTLHTGDVRGIANLTEEEYKYASQVAIWASCGQIAVPGTAFTAGRSSLIEPTSDAKQIRVFDSIKAILALANGWTRHLYVGMYLRGELDKDIRTVEIVNDQGLAGAAANNEDGIMKETINGKEYYTRTMYVASATSTWIDGYTTKVYSTDAPSGTIFTAADGSALVTETENGVTYYKVDRRVCVHGCGASETAAHNFAGGNTCVDCGYTVYTVSFNTFGFSGEIAAQRVEENGTAAKPADPTSTDSSLKFGGWYADESCTTAFDFNNPITANATVYAKWTTGAGVTVSGQVKSYNPNNATTVNLKQGGSVMYSTTIAAASGSGQVVQNFSISSVVAGTYDLVVTKAGHLTYTVTGVVVGSSDVDLTADARSEISLLTLLCGDINGDGWINFTDLQILRNVSNYGKQTVEPGVNELADLTGDGWVNFTDLQLLRNVSNYGKSNVSVSYGSYMYAANRR